MNCVVVSPRQEPAVGGGWGRAGVGVGDTQLKKDNKSYFQDLGSILQNTTQNPLHISWL